MGHNSDERSSDAGGSVESTVLAGAMRSLGFAVLNRVVGGEGDAGASFEIVGDIPDWWERWLGESASALERSPFLEDFVSGAARDFWDNPLPSGSLRSGLWEETSAESEPGEPGIKSPRFFEATASWSQDSGALLVIEPADERLERERMYVQSVHELNLDLRRLQKESEKKQILLECITHDLGNPLATVLLNLEFVARQVEDQPKLSAAVHRAIGQAKRQRSLVRSISDVFAADLESMREPNAHGSTFPDLVGVAAEVSSGCAITASERSVTLCPFFRAPLPVVGDRVYLARLLENLIVNGIRHSPEGGTVKIRFAEEDGFAVCRVEDEGEGIEPEEIESIFDPFSHGRAGQKGESGLGLYFCRLTAEMWGGRIEVWNQPEGGACFEVWLRRGEGK